MAVAVMVMHAMKDHGSKETTKKRCAASIRLSRDHHFRRLDDGQGGLAALQLQLLDGVTRDHRGQPLVAEPQADLGEQPLYADLFDDAAKLVPAADRDHDSQPACGPAHP